jgi:hypothetical protein
MPYRWRPLHEPHPVHLGGWQLFRLFASETLDDPNPPWWDYVFLENHPTLMQRIETTQYYAAAQSP